MPRGLVAIACASVLFTAACTSSTTGTAARVRSSQGAAGSSSATPLGAQLLTPEDLPAGWTVSDSADPASLPAPPCLQTAITALATTDKARVQLVKGSTLPLLEQQVGRYPSPGLADTKYAAALAALDGCTTFDFDYQGLRATGSIARMAFRSLGDRSTAWHITVQAMGVAASGDAVLVAKGAELELVVYLNLGATDARDFAPLALAAVAKLRP